MILLLAGSDPGSNLDGLLHFAEQLDLAGFPAVIDETVFPTDAARSLYYDAAPYLANADETAFDHIFILAAEAVSEETALRLRQLSTHRAEIPVTMLGHFDSHQSRVGATAKVAYALGREPRVIDLEAIGTEPLRGNGFPLVASVGLPHRDEAPRPEVVLIAPGDLFQEPLALSLLGAMAQLRSMSTTIVTNAKGRDVLRDAGLSDIRAFGFSEMTPHALARLADIAVFLGETIPGERMSHFALQVMASAGVVIDGTGDGSLLASGAPALLGPKSLGAVVPYLEQSVLPNRARIGQEAKQSTWLERRSLNVLIREVGLNGTGKKNSPTAAPSRTVFLPTNGLGLGHAQRCALIAAELPTQDDILFLASHACTSLLAPKGFAARPMIGRSNLHELDTAHDVANYLRLRQELRPGDTLVFDGGYVFDSIYRTILEKGLKGIWIRRGLWRPGQARSANLKRETAFGQVIVPDEAFEENRAQVTFGPAIRNVGPIVEVSRLSNTQVDATRANLARRFRQDFKQLVVTMLGSGVAVDRTAQLQAISNFIGMRPDVLHLVVIWPGARVPAGLGAQPNTHLVRTRSSLALAQCADLTISAAGYNSFHEFLYNGVPTIFVPQIAPIMDDQEARANAAANRGLAVAVMPEEILRLEREIAGFLDNGRGADIRQALAKVKLPEPGNKDAARLISEVSHAR